MQTQQEVVDLRGPIATYERVPQITGSESPV
jgi:hypothetical protein